MLRLVLRKVIPRRYATMATRSVPEGFTLLEEGSAGVIYPKEGEAFYNKVQIVNRDLSVLVYNLFAEQLQVEAAEQAARRAAKQPWRNLPPTREHWSWTPNLSTPSSGSSDSASEAAQDPAKLLEKLPEQPGLFVLEALAATGLRSVRYAREITSGVGLRRIMVNDLEESAVEAIRRNIDYNGLDPDRVVAHRGDAAALMYAHRAQSTKREPTRLGSVNGGDDASMPFDAVDIDPYGSPSPFLDAAVQSVSEGGLLAVTATDLSVLCGNHQDVCLSKYGSVALKARYAHEMAVRVVLAAIERQANRYNRYIVPLVGLQIDFYLRVFVRVYTSRSEVKRVGTKLSYIYQSKGCSSFYLQPLGEEKKPTKVGPATLRPEIGAVCEQSGSKWAVGGPIWSAPTSNPAFLRAAIERLRSAPPAAATAGSGAQPFDARKLQYSRRVEGLLVAASEELADVPLYYSLPTLCKTLHCECPPMPTVQAAIMNAGYRVSQSHVDSDALKTDAPPEVMWDVMRAWVREHPIAERRRAGRNQRDATAEASASIPPAKAKAAARTSVGERILSVAPKIDVDFTYPPELRRRLARKKENKGKVARWAPNPEENWGPKRRAEGNAQMQTHKRSRRAPEKKAE